MDKCINISWVIESQQWMYMQASIFGYFIASVISFDMTEHTDFIVFLKKTFTCMQKLHQVCV